MEFVAGVVNNVHSWASKINPSTLSGAIDIVFVKQPDGTYSSTPFYIKFGKLGVLRAKEKVVYVEINGAEINQRMCLDDGGLAYFEIMEDGEVEEEEECQVSHSRSNSATRIQELNTSSNDREYDKSDSRKRSKKEDTYKLLSKASKSIRKHGCPVQDRKDSSNIDLPEICHNTETTSEEKEDDENEVSIIDDIKKKLTLNLSEQELREEWKLKTGLNEVSFSVTTQYQGTTRCFCSIFVWNQNTKIIISDIDGTITKSDVRGMILPMIGMHDWAQEEVTKLYSRVSSNGYQILYLSARSISQAGATREYIRSLQQGELVLPHGPLFLNPEGAFRAFKKEVIDRTPEVFKIQCLLQLRHLFSGSTPYVAGYGNRPNDIEAYQTVEIPRERIFIINKVGEVKGSISETMLTNYAEQSNLVDYYFPPIQKDYGRIDHKYWEAPLPDIGF